MDVGTGSHKHMNAKRVSDIYTNKQWLITNGLNPDLALPSNQTALIVAKTALSMGVPKDFKWPAVRSKKPETYELNYIVVAGAGKRRKGGMFRGPVPGPPPVENPMMEAQRRWDENERINREGLRQFIANQRIEDARRNAEAQRAEDAQRVHNARIAQEARRVARPEVESVGADTNCCPRSVSGFSLFELGRLLTGSGPGDPNEQETVILDLVANTTPSMEEAFGARDIDREDDIIFNFNDTIKELEDSTEPFTDERRQWLQNYKDVMMDYRRRTLADLDMDLTNNLSRIRWVGYYHDTSRRDLQRARSWVEANIAIKKWNNKARMLFNDLQNMRPNEHALIVRANDSIRDIYNALIDEFELEPQPVGRGKMRGGVKFRIRTKPNGKVEVFENNQPVDKEFDTKEEAKDYARQRAQFFFKRMVDITRDDRATQPLRKTAEQSDKYYDELSFQGEMGESPVVEPAEKRGLDYVAHVLPTIHVANEVLTQLANDNDAEDLKPKASRWSGFGYKRFGDTAYFM